MTNYPFESPAFTTRYGSAPTQVQKSYFKLLLRSLVGIEPGGLLANLASRFYGEIDWSLISVRQDEPVPGDECNQINITFPIDKGGQAVMQVYEWCEDRGHWGVGLGTSDGLRLVYQSLRNDASSVAADRFYGSFHVPVRVG